MMSRRYEELTSADLSGSPLRHAVAVLPIAAIEQHGPHLPLGTDAIIADHMVGLTVERLPEAVPVTILPTMRLGVSTEHARFAGTLGHRWDTMIRSLIEVGDGLAATGFRRLVIVSSHGGNTPAMDTAALELRAGHDMLVAPVSWQRFGYPPALLPDDEIAVGIHGGAIETALMLFFRPDLVRGDGVSDFASLQSEMEIRTKRLRAHGRLGFGWLAGDLNEAGTVGNAGLANAEMGRAIAEHQVAGFIEFVQDVAAFDLAHLR
ncbi:creatininase family protein [Consotaella aegiceratis]|uniref:creatininase family protein n=1 Tax=Consotaella aegiceratis TaxID=3097961 RepID=UPI002F42A7ED